MRMLSVLFWLVLCEFYEFYLREFSWSGDFLSSRLKLVHMLECLFMQTEARAGLILQEKNGAHILVIFPTEN